jgi:tetratricopeptide (TPR) repeat protein
MKKIFFSVLILLSCSTCAFAGDYYTVGINCFNRGLYDNAIQNFQRAVRISPKNVNARYYLAQAYLAKNKISEAEDQYTRIILLSPNSSAGRLSQKGIFLIQQAYRKPEVQNHSASGSYGNDYLAYVISQSAPIVRWAHFPITVYIEAKPQRAIAIQACQQWEAKTGIVRFRFVNTPNAQINIKFLSSLESTDTKDSFVAGYSKPYAQGENMVRSDIQVLTFDPETKQNISNSFIYFTLLHELGHSLGFKGHSPNQKDVMYDSASEAKTQLTSRDVNTMKMLYEYDRKTLIAKIKGSGDVRLKEAQDYAKKMPDKAVAWENLGDVYKSENAYNNAISCYKKAVALEPNKAEAYGLLGNAYLSTGDNSGAYSNLKKACDLDKTNIYYVYKFVQAAAQVNQRNTALNYIDNFIKRNPSSANDSKLKQLKASLR